MDHSPQNLENFGDKFTNDEFWRACHAATVENSTHIELKGADTENSVSENVQEFCTSVNESILSTPNGIFPSAGADTENSVSENLKDFCTNVNESILSTQNGIFPSAGADTENFVSENLKDFSTRVNESILSTQNGIFPSADCDESMHGSFAYILQYISKARNRVKMYKTPSNPPIEDVEQPYLVNGPVGLNDSRERPNYEGYDSANRSIDELQRENEELKQQLTCIICCTNRKCVLFTPCGHMVICLSCKQYVAQKCPLCRGNILDKIVVSIE